jgi:hypothetical protein
MELWTKTSKKEKAFYVFATFLALYFVISNYVIVDRLKSSPLQLFDSEIIEPKIILPEEKNNSFEKLSEEINLIEKDDIRYITIMMRDKSGQAKATIVYFPGGRDGVGHDEERNGNKESNLMEFGLQYLSGSNLAFAHHGNCPNMYYLEQCSGVQYDDAGHVISKKCVCIRI